MPGDIEHGKTMPGHCRIYFFPLPGVAFTLQSAFCGMFAAFVLIFQPFFPTYMAERFRSGFLLSCLPRIVAVLILAKPFAEFSEAEISVHTGRLDRRISHGIAR